MSEEPSSKNLPLSRKALLEWAYRERIASAMAGVVGHLPFGAEPESFAHGYLTYEEKDGAEVSAETRFDLASLTKVMVTTTLLAKLYQKGQIDLSAPATKYLRDFRSLPESVTLERLLSHQAGLVAWEPWYKEVVSSFGCESKPQEVFRIPRRVRAERMREVLSRIVPVREVGVEAVYSDAGFLILGFLLEEVFGAEIHEIAQREIFSAWGLNSLGYLPEGPESIAATEICAWRGGLMQGRVHDDNCDVMGGVAGHAGLFGNVRDVYRWAEGWLGDRIDAKVRERFFSPIPGVLRVLGFDRPSPEGSAPLWSPLSVGHLGFTGTSIWMNPLSGKTAVLLTNRVHPSRENPRILELRRAFYRLALE